MQQRGAVDCSGYTTLALVIHYKLDDYAFFIALSSKEHNSAEVLRLSNLFSAITVIIKRVVEHKPIVQGGVWGNCQAGEIYFCLPKGLEDLLGVTQDLTRIL